MKLIDNGKKPNELINASILFYLPPSTPYGNLQLKLIKIVQRLDEANRRIIDSYDFWKNSINNTMVINSFEQHIFANEQFIYLIRRSADELISLIWLLSEYEKNNKYPKEIKIDCLGSLIKQTNSTRLDIFNSNINIIKLLNEVSNAFKHSFINSEHTLLGTDEPRIHALSLDYNKNKSQPKFYDFSINEIVNEYNIFYKDCMSWLRIYSTKTTNKTEERNE
jgi:hypothetical protein